MANGAQGVSVMEDEGTLADHLSGIAATDGKWHHIAGMCCSCLCALHWIWHTVNTKQLLQTYRASFV